MGRGRLTAGEPTVVLDGYSYLECPRWRDGRLWVSDFYTDQVVATDCRGGTEVVQLYVRDRVGSVTRPVRELKGFIKLSLKPGESQRVRFTLSGADLAFTGQDHLTRPETGFFDVYVGGDSQARASAELELVAG